MTGDDSQPPLQEAPVKRPEATGQISYLEKRGQGTYHGGGWKTPIQNLGGLYAVHEYSELPTRSMNFSWLSIKIMKNMYLGTRKFCFVFKAVLFFSKLFFSV